MYFPHAFWTNQVSLTPSLIAYYKLENNGLDSSGNGYHLSDNGTPSYSAGKIGTSLYTPDLSSFLTKESDPAFQLTSSKTFTLWIRVNAIPVTSATQVFMGKVSVDNGGGGNYYLAVIGDGSQLAWQLYNNNGNSENIIIYDFYYPSQTISIGVWYFVACWVDLENRTFSLQVNNGDIVTLPLGTGNILDATNARFVLGSAIASVDADNNVDEVGVWDKVLSAEERNFLWNAGNGRTHPF